MKVSTIKTICDMLIYAEATIFRCDRARRVLDHLEIDFKDITISQDRRGLIELAHNEVYLKDDFKPIQLGKYSIEFQFSEGFEKILNIKILDAIYTSKELNTIVQALSPLIDNRFEHFLENFKVKKKGITLLNVTKTKNGYGFYPDSSLPHIYYETKKKKSSKLKNFTITLHKRDTNLKDKDKTDKWLKQSILYMYPDYGGVCFWVPPNGMAAGMELFEDVLDSNSSLYKSLLEWIWSYHDSRKKSFNWIAFNKEGRRLHCELQELMQDKYIIVYGIN